LYSGGAVHFSKADKLTLSLNIDKVLGLAEIAAQYLLIKPKSLKIEAQIGTDFKKLADNVVETVKALREALLLINTDFDAAREKAKLVEDTRREVRNLEWKILKTLLDKDQLKPDALLTKQIVELTAIVADKAESLSDFVDTLALKYKTLV
ncbi:MAG: DUF47 family protein, partial [Candidatus Helarchaeales archaeon]